MTKIILSGCLIMNQNKEILLLHRKDHKYFETPGGKVRAEECADSRNPTMLELQKTAMREAYEELGDGIKLDNLFFLRSIDFALPDGRKATANKFLTRVLHGTPRVNEPDVFSELRWISSKDLGKVKLSPDLKLIKEDVKRILEK